MLTEVRDIFKENYQNKKILHILVNKYFINDKYQPMFDKKINSDSISLPDKEDLGHRVFSVPFCCLESNY